MKKLLLIINPKSGIKKNTQIYENVQNIITDNEWELDTVFTEYAGHATEIVKDTHGYDRIVCMGGDGTFNETANGLLLNPTKCELGYIPSGSTNDFAHGLGLPKKIYKSANLAANQASFPTDMGKFRIDGEYNRFFSYVASFGMFTKLSYSTDQKIKNMFGHMAYVFEGIKSISELQKFKPFKMRIEFSDTDAIESEFIFGAITNSTSLGGLVKLDKNKVHVGDGMFELLLIRKPKNLAELTQTVTELLSNRYKTENIFFSHIKNIRMISETPLDWTLDGEYAGKVTTADIEVLHGAINIVRPAKIRKKPFTKKKQV